MNDIQLLDGVVNAWILDFCDWVNDTERLYPLLSEDELERTARIKSLEAKNAFIICRVVTRLLLAHILKKDILIHGFHYNTYGKPYIPFDGKEHVAFNISHSHHYGLIAISRHEAIGVDIEHIRVIEDLFDLAENVFSKSEQLQLKALPVEKQLQGFYRCWTCKEAFIKAVGMGVSYGLDRFDVLLNPDKPAELLSIDGRCSVANKWSVQALSLDEYYAAAIAVPGLIESIVVRKLDPTILEQVVVGNCKRD